MFSLSVYAKFGGRPQGEREPNLCQRGFDLIKLFFGHVIKISALNLSPEGGMKFLDRDGLERGRLVLCWHFVNRFACLLSPYKRNCIVQEDMRNPFNLLLIISLEMPR